jgi:hypothetical protein
VLCSGGVVHGQNMMSCRNRFIIALSRPNIGDLVTIDPELQVCPAAKCRRPLHNQPTSLRVARLTTKVEVAMDLLSASKSFYSVIAFLFIALLSSGSPVALGQQMEQQNAAPAEEAPKIPNDQLDSLVAPIALYPDPLLSQTLESSPPSYR